LNFDNSNVTVTRTSISDLGAPQGEGIRLIGGNTDVTIADTTITNALIVGIRIDTGNDVTIARTTIEDAGDGIGIGSDNTVSLNDARLAGTFGLNGIRIGDTDNMLSGEGNTAAGATFTTFCNAPSQDNGSFFDFDDNGTGNPGTCPVVP